MILRQLLVDHRGEYSVMVIGHRDVIRCSSKLGSIWGHEVSLGLMIKRTRVYIRYSNVPPFIPLGLHSRQTVKTQPGGTREWARWVRSVK